MEESLIPKMQRINVSPQHLILDPNNPRLISRKEDRVNEENILDQGILENTRRKMDGGDKDTFRIRDLEKSILTNGWQPIDSIFVQQCADRGYLVLEGNRRVTAIRNLLNNGEIGDALRAELSMIEVMEILEEDLARAALEKKISYLLGVRHHGSLVQWSPFAQANNIYIEYLHISGQDDDSFVWNEQFGHHIADALGIKLDTVKERLRVYRAMRQIGNFPIVKQSEATGGGMKDRYYSVCQAALQSKAKKLAEYIKQDPSTFALEGESIERMDNLCHFSVRNREAAPINNPPQWKALDKILSDEDEQKRSTMLAEVENEKKRPDSVWARRAEELRKLQWDRWLEKVAHIINGITASDINRNDDEQRQVVTKLAELLDQLNEVTVNVGETNA